MNRRPNFELMHDVLDQLRLHPEQHDQSHFRVVDDEGCGTTMCFAGWTCQLAGRRWLDEHDRFYVGNGEEYVYVEPFDVRHGPTTRYVHCEDAAQAALRIDDDALERLFYLATDLHDLELTVKELEQEWEKVDRA